MSINGKRAQVRNQALSRHATQKSASFLRSIIAEVGRRYASREKVIEQSRRRWGRRRGEVEGRLWRWAR